METTILSVQNVSVSFKSKRGTVHKAVDSVSFALEMGESLAIVGESGSGKTTLMRAVMGLVPIESGSIRLMGKDISELTPAEFNKIRRECGYMPQDPYGAIPPGLSALEAVTEPLQIASIPISKEEMARRAKSLLAELKINDERIFASRAVGLSGGQRQRVGIARALILSPKLLLCDEPTSMQDVSTRSEITDVFKRRTERGMSMIFVTHDLLLAGKSADRIIVMKDGIVCEDGTSKEILNNPKSEYTQLLLDSVPKFKTTEENNS